MIELRSLSFAHGGSSPHFRSLNLRIERGERVVLLGVNGSGKSTLLRILNGLLFPGEGNYLFQGRPVTKGSLRRGGFHQEFRKQSVLLFQNPDSMLFHPTVYDEIAYGARQLGCQDVTERVITWGRRLGVESYLETPPFLLSWGEKKRVALASLLILEPTLLLLDEPMAGLDPGVTGWLVDFLQELDVTLLVSTHSLSMAPELGERALVLSPDGRLLFDGSVEEVVGSHERLKEAGLLHIHKHGTETEQKYHLHDWE